MNTQLSKKVLLQSGIISRITMEVKTQKDRLIRNGSLFTEKKDRLRMWKNVQRQYKEYNKRYIIGRGHGYGPDLDNSYIIYLSKYDNGKYQTLYSETYFD